MHKVVVLALPDFVPLDFGIACEIFGLVSDPDGAKAYDVQVCGPSRKVRTRDFEIRVARGLDALVRADTIIVPGIQNTTQPIPKAVCRALRSAWERDARVTSICTGAFVLAASGLLDGRRATTHWMFAAQLAQLYPKITVEPNVLFVDEDSIVTSAGASSGLDMCLHLVRRDHGQAAAARAARLAVAPLSRDGGQAQFIHHDPPSSPSSLARLLDWMRNNLNTPHSVESLAAQARMSPRTFARRFREQTGTTPWQWLVTARVQRAQELLEDTDTSIEQTAILAGFDSPVTFRARFRRAVGLTPTEYRRRFTIANISDVPGYPLPPI
jgi:transcriptional regulator GlxA family with amidase domain